MMAVMKLGVLGIGYVLRHGVPLFVFPSRLMMSDPDDERL